jgi:diguanylate cyclase (GGDEF)-like protein
VSFAAAGDGRLRVLLVDDTATVRVLLRRVLEGSGSFVVVGEAADGREAVDLAGRYQPDVVLLDLAMPVMDGLEAIPLIRACSPASSIVVLSGFNAERVAAQALDLGAAACLEKRHRPEELVRLIADATGAPVPAPLPPYTGVLTREEPSPTTAPRLRVLVADDDEASRFVVGAMVARLGHHVELAAGGEEAWAEYQRSGADVLLTDWMMPGLDGPELCRRIRQRPEGLYTYVIMLSALSEREHVLEAMRAGADDHLAKPLHPLDLEARLVAATRVTALHSELDRYRQQLWEMHLDSAAAARTDYLTGLGNRLRLAEDLETLVSRTDRYGSRYWIAVFDLDHFHEYNERFGHPAGDVALSSVAEALGRVSRRGDVVYRYGGEEFLAVLSDLRPEMAKSAAERFRREVEDLGIVHPDAPAGVLTVSIGLAPLCPVGDLHAMVAPADRALYAAKAAGRNRVALGSPLSSVI